MNEKPNIPVCRPLLLGTEKTYVLDALESGWISSSGAYLSRFEAAFSRFVDCKHGVACSNGTTAIQLALRSVGVGRGDRVVVPSFTMMASVFPILHLGALPVFVDCTPDTWTMDPSALNRVSAPIKAVLPVHIYGHPCDMEPIAEWARSKQAFVVEDAAEAQGASYKGRPAGSLSDVAAFSFYANKILTCGEGGMVTTNDDKIASRARYFENLCFEKDPSQRFIHHEIGYNFRMTNIQAAVGFAQTEQTKKLVEMRRSVARNYLQALQPLDEYLQFPVEREWAKNVYWMFGVVLREKARLNAPELIARMSEHGIETRRFFCPAHLQPSLKSYAQDTHAPESERLWERGLYLPSSPDLSKSEMDKIVSALNQILRSHRKLLRAG